MKPNDPPTDSRLQRTLDRLAALVDLRNRRAAEAPPRVGPEVVAKAQPGAKPCGGCGEAARARREAMREAERQRREAEQNKA